jgi:hypothetical protein
MPDVTIDWVGVIVAVVVAMVIGGLWYGPLFGKQWLTLMGKTREEMMANGGLGYLFAALGSFMTAIVLSYVTQWANANGFGEGALVGIVMWAGFALSTVVTGGVFEGRQWELIMINSGNSLTTFLIVGGIVGAFN